MIKSLLIAATVLFLGVFVYVAFVDIEVEQQQVTETLAPEQFLHKSSAGTP